MPIQINTQQIMKAIAMIEKATQSPLARPLIEKILPDLGVGPEDLALLAAHDADYDRWLAEIDHHG